MLIYHNEYLKDFKLDYEQNDEIFNPITFRKYDWDNFYNHLEEIFKRISENEVIEDFEIKTFRVYGQARNNIEETAYDKLIQITYKQKKVNSHHLFKILVPKMLKGRFIINGSQRFAIYQLVDLPLIVRKDQIRIATNIRHLIINKSNKDKDYNYYINKSKSKKIPLILVWLGYFGVTKLNDLLQKYNLAKIKLKEDIPDEFKFASDLLEYEVLNKDSNIKLILEDLHKTPLTKIFKRKDKLEKDIWTENTNVDITYDFYKTWEDIIKIDIFTEKLLKTGNIFEEILLGIDEPPYDINDISKKRVRSMEYIHSFIINYIYENFYQNIESLRKPINRNINLVDIMVGKHFQELLQLSKLDSNLIASIMELYKVTYTGYGALSKDSIQLELRDIHPTYYSNIDPIFTPDGEKCGVVNYLTIDCKLDKYGRFVNIK